MIRILLTIIAFLISVLSSFAQIAGDELRKNGALDDAIKAYKLDFQKDPSNAKNIYNLASTFALTYMQKDSAFHYLHIALENDNTLWALADNDFLSLSTDPRWKNLEQHQLKKYQKAKGSLKKPDYAIKLLRLIQKDQALDYQMDMAKQYFMQHGKAPHWYYPLAELKKTISAGNFEEMESLISTHGWPSYATVGKLAADAPLLIINHHENEEIRIKYLDQIKNACFNNEGSCMEYAKIQDRILVNTGKSQMYGMQFRYNVQRTLEPFPILDPEHVDRRRLKIGLEPLKDYLKRKINYDWNVTQKK